MKKNYENANWTRGKCVTCNDWKDERKHTHAHTYKNIEINEMEKLVDLHRTSMITIAKNQTSSMKKISPRATPCKQR